MKHGYLLLLAAGCGFKSSAGNADAALPVPDGGVPGMWSLDSAAEFGAAGHVVKDMTVEARGSLTPNAYTYGGLVAHGLQGTKLWMQTDMDWTHVATVTASGAGLWRGEALSQTSALAYLGITNNNIMTVWFEGEVWLDATSNEIFGLDGNDVAFIELAPPGTTTYTRVMKNGPPVAVATPVTGWYPIRIGFADGDNSSSFNFTHSDSGSTTIPWTRDRLRARTSELHGVLRTVFARQILGGGQGQTPPVAHFDESALLPQSTFNTALQGAGTDDWSARYFGQVYVTQPGTYALRSISDDGHRARLGPGRGEKNWRRDDGVGSQDAITTVPAMLAAGWNDVTVDYNEVAGQQNLRVQIQGPDFVSFVDVPRDQLRPVEPADDRLAFGGDDAIQQVTDNGGAGNPGTATMTVAGYTGETVTSIDLTYQIDSPHWDQIKVDLETPTTSTTVGTRLTIRDKDRGLGDGDRVAQLTISSLGPAGLGGLLGGAANGVWNLHVYDVIQNGGPSSLKSAKLTLHTTGGPDKVARTASWTSQVLDAQTNVIAIDSVTWADRSQVGTGLEVRVGTCQQADCSDVTWSGPVKKATAFAVGPARYLQLRVDMTSMGTLEPELQSLSVMYRRDP
jgi:hypothetical protein